METIEQYHDYLYEKFFYDDIVPAPLLTSNFLRCLGGVKNGSEKEGKRERRKKH